MKIVGPPLGHEMALSNQELCQITSRVYTEVLFFFWGFDVSNQRCSSYRISQIIPKHPSKKGPFYITFFVSSYDIDSKDQICVYLKTHAVCAENCFLPRALPVYPYLQGSGLEDHKLTILYFSDASSRVCRCCSWVRQNCGKHGPLQRTCLSWLSNSWCWEKWWFG